MMVSSSKPRSADIQVLSSDLPPESLRYRIHGASDVESFLQVGEQCALDIRSALQKNGVAIEACSSILDFGCGCGRVLRWMKPLSSTSHLFGTDIDHEAVSWCNRHLSFASFMVNSWLPPLGCANDSFDLIYAISVFTHLNEEYQFCWLYELQRLAKPGAIVLLSLHGDTHINNLSREQAEEIRKRGMFFLESGGWRGMFPDWYQDSFHTKKYVLEKFSLYFDIIDYIPKGMNHLQDVVILRKSLSKRDITEPPTPVDAIVYRLKWQINLLENTIARKNEHIVRLENLIQRIENGRILKALSRAQRLLSYVL